MLDAGPYSYWRLDDPSGSTSAASAVLSNEGADDGVYASTGGVVLGSSSYPGPLAGGSTDAARISNAYVQLPGSLVASSSYQSIALWVKTTSPGIVFSYEDSAVSSGASTTGNYTPSLYIGTDGKLNGEFWYSGNTHPVTTSSVVDDGQWHFVAEPVQGLQQGQLAPVPFLGVIGEERRGKQPPGHREPVRGRRVPPCQGGPGREPIQHHQRLGAELPGRGSRPGGRPRGHQRPFPNSTSRLSGR